MLVLPVKCWLKTFMPHTPSKAVTLFDTLDCARVESLCTTDTPLAFSDASRGAIEASHVALRELADRGEPIYGLTTGFGPFVKFASANDGDASHGAGLIAHLGAGFGAPAPRAVVRAAMLLRCQTLSQGFSGASPAVSDAMLALYNSGLCPVVPELGSVGASGDLIPLSHVAAVLSGHGSVLDDSGSVVPGLPELRRARLTPLPLVSRDALSLVNGTSFMTAFAAIAVARAERLLDLAERLTGWAYRQLGCRAQALDHRLHQARGHAGQVESAANILAEAELYGSWEIPDRPLQEIYSLRCAPQMLGACRDLLNFARATVDHEINGVNDNPLVLTDTPTVLHGGNFQGQQIAFASDALNACLVQIGVLVERQVDAINNPAINGGAPLLLAWQPGADSGLAGAQLTATSLVAEMRHHALPSANSSIPTNGGNQDVVSMGTTAARAAFGQTERLPGILAVLGISLAQLNFLRQHNRCAGPLTPTPAWFPDYQPFTHDRALYTDIQRIARCLLEPAGAAPSSRHSVAA